MFRLTVHYPLVCTETPADRKTQGTVGSWQAARGEPGKLKKKIEYSLFCPLTLSCNFKVVGQEFKAYQSMMIIYFYLNF